MKPEPEEIMVKLSHAKIQLYPDEKIWFTLFDEKGKLLFCTAIENEEDFEFLHKMFHKKVDIHRLK